MLDYDITDTLTALEILENALKKRKAQLLQKSWLTRAVGIDDALLLVKQLQVKAHEADNENADLLAHLESPTPVSIDSIFTKIKEGDSDPGDRQETEQQGDTGTAGGED
jgi:hypothetical protein